MTLNRSGARRKVTQRPSVTSKNVEETGNEPPLSRERIIAGAVELLDSEGMGKLTMRRLADYLGSGVMSLYWHIDNKEVVFDLALDSVLEYGGRPHTSGSGNWRAEVIYMLEDWRACMLRHPWSASLLPRRALGPSILYRLEFLSTTLSTAGVTSADLNAAIWSLWNYVMGATITRSSFESSEEDRATTQRRSAHPARHYPAIERTHLLADNDWDGAFRRGLDFLLDGLSPD